MAAARSGRPGKYEHVTRILSMQALVLRDGKRLLLPAEELVPGDIVYLPVNGMGGWNEIIAAISPTILTVSRALDPFVLAKAISDD